MSASQGNLSQNWKRPDELLKLHRLKQKKKQLAARFNNSSKAEIKETDKAKLLEAVVAQKRKNPFAKSTDNAKKAKVEPDALSLQDDSLLDLINTPTQTPPIFVRETPTRPPPAKLVLQPFDAQNFSKLLHQNSVAEEEDVLDEQKYSKHLPMDWSLKTRVRFFCRSELPATTLKTSQMASSLTSCVRCIDTQNTSNGLDISPATRFNQATYYWQHPHLPWLTMFPRNSKENTGIQVGERERKALVVDWDHSFQGLFQLLRARQCPYFYLCCNTFTVLFRAAGTGGRAEIHALMSPTTRGMRSALRQEGIEYSMPLKKDVTGLNKSGDNSFNTDESNSTSAAEAPIPANIVEADEVEPSKCIDGDADEDDDEEEDWLKSLGVDENEIRRINTAHTRQQKAKEMADDFSDNSLVLIEGVECQGFFSFLLNAKSTIPTVGRLAGIPPTLFAPVAFPKATLQHLSTRSNKVRMDGVDYCSIEVKGVVMPTFLPYICALLGETKSTFSATLATSSNTLAFSKATQKLLEDPKQVEEGDDETAGQVFGQENLSDCGLTTSVIESMCRTGAHAVGLLERACFDKERGYAWS